MLSREHRAVSKTQHTASGVAPRRKVGAAPRTRGKAGGLIGALARQHATLMMHGRAPRCLDLQNE